MFYDNYVLACELRGKKPTPVAQELGCTSSNVAQWKKGSTPRSAVLQKIAAYLDVTPQWLVFGDEGPDGDVIKKGPIQKDEADEMDAELVAIWNDSDETDRKLLLDMARAIKLRRENK